MSGGLLRPEDVARRLAVSKQTIYNLVKAGALDAVLFSTRPGRQTVRFTEESVGSFISANSHERGTAGICSMGKNTSSIPRDSVGGCDVNRSR